MKVLALLVLAISSLSIAAAAPRENRAAKIFEWLEQDQWFDFPQQFLDDGTRVPAIDSGVIVPDPGRNEVSQRYLHEIDYQADVLSRCGEAAVDTSLEKLKSKDPYIVLIAARALDKLLGFKSEIWIERRPPVDHMIKVYRARADLCFPDRLKPDESR